MGEEHHGTQIAVRMLASDLRRGKEDSLRHNESITALDRRMERIEALLRAAPAYSVFIGEVERLLYEAIQSIEMFAQIRDLYPDSEVATKPFSDWRPLAGKAPETEAIRDGIRWARFLESHWRHVAGFCLSQKINSTMVCHGDLNECIANWRTGHSNMSGDLCLQLLRSHYKNIQDSLRDCDGKRFLAALSAGTLRNDGL